MESKKNEKYDLERKRPLFFGIGLMVALAFTISAFEWRTEINPICLFCDEESEEEWSFVEIAPVTKQEELKPPTPKIEKKPIRSVEADEELEKEIEETLEAEESPSPGNDSDYMPPEIPDELVDEVIRNTVEVMPAYAGGIENFYKFIQENVKIPRQAKRMGVEGKVFVKFIVEKDGSLSNIEVIKGIGAGIDEEALRVMNLVPDWSPGKQGDIRVRVRMVVPIKFELK